MSTIHRRPSATGSVSSRGDDVLLRSRFSDQSLGERRSRFTPSKGKTHNTSFGHRGPPKKEEIPSAAASPIINISVGHGRPPSPTDHDEGKDGLADELDYITVSAPVGQSQSESLSLAQLRADKASRILGIKHRKSMEPIPASTRTSIVSTRSARDGLPSPSFTPTSPLTSLYVVSGLPKSPHTWTLADPDSVLGLHHSDGAVSRWWRPEVLGSTVSPGAGGGKKKKRGKSEEILKGAGALSKQEVGKMLSKALKVYSPPLPNIMHACLPSVNYSSLSLVKSKLLLLRYSQLRLFTHLLLRFLRLTRLSRLRPLETFFVLLFCQAPIIDLQLPLSIILTATTPLFALHRAI